jgi:hypothetical protein
VSDLGAIKELSTGDFSEHNFTALARSVEGQQNWSRPFDPKHFFGVAHNLMNNGVLKVWGCQSAVLGGLFVRNIFSGTPDGIVMFYWSFDGKASKQLWNLFTEEAKRLDCVRIASSTFGPVRVEAMKRLYRMKGMTESECVYTRFLK